MEHVTTPPSIPEATKRTPWGTIIGTILILGIVVFAAYYALSTRIAISTNPATSVR